MQITLIVTQVVDVLLDNVSEYAVVINELYDTNLTCSCLTIAWHQTLEEMAQDVTI